MFDLNFLHFLIQEVFDYDSFCFFFCHSQCTEFYKLLVVDPSDSRLMDNCCIYMFCVNLRNRADFCVIHDNRIALYMSMAEIFTDCSWVKYLPGAAFCNGSGYDLCRASFTIHFYHHIGSCFLVSMCHQLLYNVQF